MYRTRLWTLYADLSPAALQLMAAQAGAPYPSVTAGAWSSVSGLGDPDQAPAWMIRLRDRLAAEGIAHDLD